MWYLIAEISIYLVSGFVVGTVVGWFFRGAHCRRDLDGLHAYWTGRVKMMDRQYARAHEDVERADRRAQELDGTLKDKVAALERVAAHLGKAEARVATLQGERNQLTHRLKSSVAHVHQIQAELQGAREHLAQKELELNAATARAKDLVSLETRMKKLQRVAATAEAKLREREAELAHAEGRLAELECAGAPPTNGHRNGHGNGKNGHAVDLPAETLDEKDDLKQIRGIGRVLEERLNELGVYRFEQIAEWTPEDVSRISESIEGSLGRITRDRWVGQARQLARQRV